MGKINSRIIVTDTKWKGRTGTVIDKLTGVYDCWVVQLDEPDAVKTTLNANYFTTLKQEVT